MTMRYFRSDQEAVTMGVSGLVNLSALLDDAKYFELVRRYRWLRDVCCSGCDRATVIRNGRDETQPHRGYLVGQGDAVSQLFQCWRVCRSCRSMFRLTPNMATFVQPWKWPAGLSAQTIF